MPKRKYNISEKEIKSLINGMIDYGPEETFKKIKQTIIIAIGDRSDLDEVCMDMYDTIIERARNLSLKINKDNEKKIKIMYEIANMLRKIAHEFHTKKSVRNKRFLEVVHSKDDAI